MNLLKKLEQQGVTLEPKLTFKSVAPLDADTLTLLRTHKADLLRDLTAPDTLRRVPWQLEALLRAAATGVLPKGTMRLEGGSVSDLSTHVMAWGCTYLAGGDPEESLKRLWRAYRAWQPEERVN